MITPMIYLFYPETANRTLEDMDQIFIHNPSAIVFTNRSATQSKRPDLFVDAEKLRVAQARNLNGSSDAVLSGNEKQKAPQESVVEV